MSRFLSRFKLSILDRYIFAEILQPFLTVLLFFTSLFLALVLKDIVGDLIGKGISFWDITRFLIYLVGEKITLTIPMACLFAGILAAGRLSGDSEIAAMRAAGISFPRMYVVFLVFGLIAMSIVAAMNLYLGPLAAGAREEFENWLKSYHSLSLARPGQFLGGGDIDGLQKGGQDIYVAAREGSELIGLQIRFWDYKLDDQKSPIMQVNGVPVRIGESVVTRVIQAEKGRLYSRYKDVSDRSKGVEEFIRMKNGYVIETDSSYSKIEVTNFLSGYMDYVLPPPKSSFGKINVRPEGYTFSELFEFLTRLRKGEHQIDFSALAAGESGKVGESIGLDATRLPSPQEMKIMAAQLRIWILQNHAKIGQPGGPTAAEMQQRIQTVFLFEGFLADVDKTERRFQIEIQRRLAVPVASLLFFFISFPLGLVVKRSGKGMSFSLAIFVFLGYYTLYTVGLDRANSGSISPIVGAWTADVALLIFGFVLMSTRTDGFAPLQFLLKPIRKINGAVIKPWLLYIYSKLPESFRARVTKIIEKVKDSHINLKITSIIQKRLEYLVKLIGRWF